MIFKKKPDRPTKGGQTDQETTDTKQFRFQIESIDSIDQKSETGQTLAISKTQKKVAIMDVTGMNTVQATTAEKLPEAVKTVRVELNTIVEYEGKYYRGVLQVTEELAKILTNLDNLKSIEEKE